jgi:CRISPR/Cas system-associated exonuclease Cas4 (RecB family)
MIKPTFSVSKIQLYLECPYKYYLRYITKTLPDRISYHLQLGLSFSDILEEIYYNSDIYNNITEEDIDVLCSTFWVPKQLKEKFTLAKQETWKFLNYPSLAEENLQKIALRNYLREYLKTYGLEKPFGVELDLTQDFGDFIFTGRADIVLFVRGKGLKVYDNKLGETQYSLENNLQLSMYTIALQRKYKLPVKEVGLRYIKQNKADYISTSELNLEECFNTFLSTIENIKKERFSKTPNRYCKYCGGCEYTNAESLL